MREEGRLVHICTFRSNKIQNVGRRRHRTAWFSGSVTRKQRRSWKNTGKNVVSLCIFTSICLLWQSDLINGENFVPFGRMKLYDKKILRRFLCVSFVQTFLRSNWNFKKLKDSIRVFYVCSVSVMMRSMNYRCLTIILNNNGYFRWAFVCLFSLQYNISLNLIDCSWSLICMAVF